MANGLNWMEDGGIYQIGQTIWALLFNLCAGEYQTGGQ
jgi:hypothetical protein